ncbi:unnamed protein product [Cuscuta campestris]|uniref:Uncharacterized protein n=1 Tax=Cuscuta campestris TaxID=132261 RepID=A0A484KYF2_9ASTE|nr:unnamed protein product [Cuscuta campestris]
MMGSRSRARTPKGDSGDDSSVANLSLDFGTPKALERMRKLTDVGAMTRLLHECIAYQCALDPDLEVILSQRHDLDKQLSVL